MPHSSENSADTAID